MALNLLRMDVRREHDVVLVRQRARQIAAALSSTRRIRLASQPHLSEIVRNAFQYAGGALVEFRIEKEPDPALQITVSDKGRHRPSPANSRRKICFAHWHGVRAHRGPAAHGCVPCGNRVERDRPSSWARTLRRASPALPRKILTGSCPKSKPRTPRECVRRTATAKSGTSKNPGRMRARQLRAAQLNRELDETNRGVVALYAELDDRADFLQRASELKSHFLSNMSHEFRTPLNSITALSQILLDRLDGDLSTEQEKQVRVIRSSAQDLMELVNDLLDLAKVEAGKVTIRPTNFDVNTLFSALRGMLRPLLSQNSSVKLVFDDPEKDIQIYSDEAKVSQILRNFISNALKFTERGEVRVSVSQGHDNTVSFSVSDTGVGIAAEDQERIFEEWSQIDGKLQKAPRDQAWACPCPASWPNCWVEMFG